MAEFLHSGHGLGASFFGVEGYKPRDREILIYPEPHEAVEKAINEKSTNRVYAYIFA